MRPFRNALAALVLVGIAACVAWAVLSSIHSAPSPAEFASGAALLSP